MRLCYSNYANKKAKSSQTYMEICILRWILLSITGIYPDGPQLMKVSLEIFQFYDSVKAICLQYKLHFKLWSFPRLAIFIMILCCEVGQHPKVTAPSQPHNRNAKCTTILHPDKHCAFHFQYSFSNYMIFNTLL